MKKLNKENLYPEELADKFDLVNKPLLDPISMNAFETAWSKF